jgi:ribosomal protein L16 Arg81 hydroxylase
MRFKDVIAPLTTTEFVERYLGQRMLLVPSATGRFAHLLPWAELNAALNRIRITGSRMRLVKDGQMLPPALYLATSQNDHGSPLKSASFERLLADGATLILDAVDELFDPIRDLTESVEDIFRIRAKVNLYAGWRTQHGFDLHYDDHDTLILQVHGRKHWKVYEPTRLHPLNKEQDIETAHPPGGAPSWDGVLEDGGMLYMPRGWWHVACPLDEASLHLTVGLSHPTGVRMLTWFLNELKSTIEARMDVPHLQTAVEQQAWIAALRTHLLAAWDDTVLDRFMAFWDAKAVARPDVHLPGTAARNVTLTPETRLRLAQGRRLSFTVSDGDGSARFVIDGKPWVCATGLVPALGRLSHLRSCSIGELHAAVAPGLAPALALLLTAMVMGGAVSVQPAPPPAVPPPPATAAGTRPRSQDPAVALHP